MKKKKKPVYYMHTLGGKPASFYTDQICYAASIGSPNKLCRSLAQIRKEQRRSKKWRKTSGFEDFEVHGHMRFTLP